VGKTTKLRSNAVGFWRYLTYSGVRPERLGP